MSAGSTHGIGSALIAWNLSVRRCRHRVRHTGDLMPQVDGDDVRALLREADGVAAALAAGRAGDEGDLSCYSSWRQCLLTMTAMMARCKGHRAMRESRDQPQRSRPDTVYGGVGTKKPSPRQ
jgi:hypothetical protein